MNRQVLREGSTFTLHRQNRYLIAELSEEHVVLSTSVKCGGQQQALRYLVNHQSCEGTQHLERHDLIKGMGQEAYHDLVCGEIGLPAGEVALLGTAANMNYAAVVVREDRGLEVTAAVTAGVQGNACCAGDPAGWRETENGWEKVDGTINTLLLINRPLTAGALARGAVTMTEAKTAALQRLAVRSLYSGDPATGTGTDQFAIAAPTHGATPLTSASPHVKLGELIGSAVREATLEALRWQNGLESSYTRSIFTALTRFGLSEERFFDDIAPYLTEGALELLRKNSKAVFYEPLVGAAAYAFAAVLDRLRYGTLPESAGVEALRQQAGIMAASLSAQTHRWDEFRTQLKDGDPMHLVLHAIALGVGREVEILNLAPNPRFLAAGVVLDLLLGDPNYPLHPVRLVGWTLTRAEKVLRDAGFDGYGGGIALFVILCVVWAGGISLAVAVMPPAFASLISVFLIYSLLALRDLLRHGADVERAATRGDLDAARFAVAKLVGRDTARMDGAACTRAAIESLSENLTDGFISPVFWYVLAGLPGLIVFKVVSTMDSMVGYKTDRYLRFGWCGARMDDWMNWIPARLTWLLLSLVAALLPGYSARKCLLVGWRQHAIVPGPNSGWSEAATAGALERRLIGPIRAGGQLVTTTWLGEPDDPPAGAQRDFHRAAVLLTATGIVAVAIAIGILYRSY